MGNPNHPTVWGLPTSPPPSKPLPPVPRSTYLTLPGPFSGISLLSHPVPSPSLSIDIMSLQAEEADYATSPPSFTFSYSSSRRESMSSVLEMSQSLLPPTPCSIRPLTPANSVDCQVYEVGEQQLGSPFLTPLSKHSAAPNQLHKLCSDLEDMQLQRHDSAKFDTTQLKHKKSLQVCTDRSCANISPPIPSPVCPSSVFDLSVNTESFYRAPRVAPLPESVDTPLSETSFIEWDEERPRLVRMKKSIVDLKSGHRVRSNTVPSTISKPTVIFDSTNPIDSGTAICQGGPTSSGQWYDGNATFYPSRGPLMLVTKKLASHRKTFFVFGSAKRLSHLDDQRSTSPSTTQTSSSCRRSHTSSNNQNNRRHGFSKLTRWMRNMVNCT